MMVDLLVTHGDKHISRDDGTPRPLRIVNSQATGTGAIIATYAGDTCLTSSTIGAAAALDALLADW
jgi:hypothetical protein